MQITPSMSEYEFCGDTELFTITRREKKEAGAFTCVTLQPGVYFAFNEIRSRYWPTFTQDVEAVGFLTINICLEGRCETALSDGKYAIVSTGQLAMGTQQPQTQFFYPTDCYLGVEFFIDLNTFEQTEPGDYLSMSGVDVPAMLNKFQCVDRLFLRRATEPMIKLAKSLFAQRNAGEIGQIRLQATMLLYLLQELDYAPENMAWFTKTQIRIARETEKQLMQDLSVRVTAKEIAKQYGISETSFKNYFKGVFGEGFLPYFRRKRMEAAAELLAHTDLKVIDIAVQVGYENQGKFAGVFKSYFGMTPLEYRRRQRFQEIKK